MSKEFIYTGIYKKGDKISLARDLIVHIDTGRIFKNPSNETTKFLKGHTFIIGRQTSHSMTTPDSFVTYSLLDGDDIITDVPEWFLEEAK